MLAISTKFNALAGAAVVATAVAITPVAAHAAPSLGSFVEGIGNSTEQTINSVVVPRPTPSSSVTASATCTGATISCILQQTAAGLQNGIRTVTVGIVNTAGILVYATLSLTAAGLQVIGDILPGPIGDLFTQAAVAFNNGAKAVANATGNGQYI